MATKETNKLKFLLCEPVPDAPEELPHRNWWRKTAERVSGGRVTLDITGLKKGYFGITPYEQYYNGPQMAIRGSEAEKKGYDVFICGCASDMALRESRALLDIPVVAPTESACLVASTLGARFSIIDLQYFTGPVTEGAVRNAGMLSKLASIRYPEEMTAGKATQMIYGGKESQIIEILRAEMVKAIKEDGAEALFVGCSITSSFLSERGIYEVDGVPIIDILAATMKMAELLLDLKKTYGIRTCRKSSYLPPSPGWDKDLPILNG